MVQLLWKTIWMLLQKWKIELPYDLGIPLVGLNLKELKAGSWGDSCIPMLIAALFTIAKRWKQPKCPSTDEWKNKMWYMHTMQLYSAFQSKGKKFNIYLLIWLLWVLVVACEIYFTNQGSNSVSLCWGYGVLATGEVPGTQQESPKSKKIWMHATTWINFENSTLSEIRQ